jgi:5-methylcytosine-specific restriction endonuclease McrA
MKKPEEIPYDQLYDLYVTQRLGVLRTARELHCRNDVVVSALALHGLSRSNHGDTPKPPERTWFVTEYTEKMRSVDDIAQELGLDESSVRHHLRKYGISIRNKPRGTQRKDILNDPEWLYEQYHTNKHTLQEIAIMTDSVLSSVVWAMKRYNIPRRKASQREYKNNPHTRVNGHLCFTKDQRNHILSRDNHHCMDPYCEGLSKSLEVHHIVPRHMGGKNVVENGITLCRKCHYKTLGKEGDFIALFQSLI